MFRGTWRLRVLLCVSYACFSLGLPDDEDAAFWMSSMRRDLLRATQRSPNTNRAKNLILFLGDGLGITAMTAARIFKGQLQGRTGEETRLHFETLPYTGLIKTYCVNTQVPDSACTATALLTGVKSNHKTLGVDRNVRRGDCATLVNNRHRLPTSVFTHALASGRKTGIVTTTRVTHASPAAAYAHAAERKWECDAHLPEDAKDKCKDIARQLIEDEPGRSIHVVMGGGHQYFVPNGTLSNQENGKKECRRMDGLDLVQRWKDNHGDNGTVVLNREQLSQAVRHKQQYLLGLFAPNHMNFDSARDPSPKGEPSLAEMTAAAIDLLDNDSGFILMVEGGRIDHGLHMNNAHRALLETVAMEEAVKVALDKTDARDTLLLVTADHSHVMTMAGYPLRGNPILGVGDISNATNTSFTTLAFANGPGWKYKYDNTTDKVVYEDPSTQDTLDIDYIQMAAVYTGEGRSETHGGEDVAVYAGGPWSHLLTGSHEQPYINHVMLYAACLGPYSGDCPRGNGPRIQSNAHWFFLLIATSLMMNHLWCYSQCYS